MPQNKTCSTSGIVVSIFIFLNALIVKIAFIKNENWYWWLFVTMPVLILAILDFRKKRKRHLPQAHNLYASS